ncbi:MAG: Minf_1886 family protein [Lentisphaeria bacterium]
MSALHDLPSRLPRILAADPRYQPAAYAFVGEAVTFTCQRLRDAENRRRHVSGQELLAGFRDLARQRFGVLALEVLEDWGIRRTEDVGNIVFNLVHHQVLGATEEDSPADFANGFAFAQAFAPPAPPPPDPAAKLPKIA